MNVGQFTLIGRAGRAFEWGADARGWNSTSSEDWRFSVSAGTVQEALAGSGRRLSREESGSLVRARARWVAGPLELGASYAANYTRVGITPPLSGDPGSFNTFWDLVTHRQRADTLAIPDSVVANTTRERGRDGAVGATWRLSKNRGLVGVEFHRGGGRVQQTLSGTGPEPATWDARLGLEWRLNPSFVGRGGYVHRFLDRDEQIADDEYVGNTMTLGFGLAPAGTTWGIDAGYAFEWRRTDYGDPTQAREGRQRLAAQLRWAF
jgi:hypothetical protein